MYKIKKAIIPVAGYGTRLFPATKVIPKAFLPIYDNGYIKPVILKLIEELDESGIEQICLIVSKNAKNLYQDFFHPVSSDHLAKLNKTAIEYENKLLKLEKKICYITQEEQFGFGHAVYLGKNFTENQPVLMILGDTLYKSNTSVNCTSQLLDFFDEFEYSTIALQEVKDEDIKSLGISKGTWDDSSKKSLTLQTIVEKPSIEYAYKHLIMDNKLFGNFGAFILTKNFFDELEMICSQKITPPEEYQLMDAFANLMKKDIVKGFIIDGKSYDMGNTTKYQEVMKEDF